MGVRRRERVGRKPASNGAHRFHNEREGYRADARNGKVHTRLLPELNGRELAALTDEQVSERLADLSAITDEEGEVIELGYQVVVPVELEDPDA